MLHVTQTGNIIPSLKIKTRRSLRTQIFVPHVFSVTYLLLKEIYDEITPRLGRDWVNKFKKNNRPD